MILWSGVFGAIIGSFLNVVLLKKNTGESAIKGRSRCFSCGKVLSWFELIPVLSFFIQLGKCRGCGSRISWQYPIVEIITVFIAIATLTQTRFGSLAYGFYFAAFCALVLIAVYDFKHKIIDKHFLYIFAGFSVANAIYRYIEVPKYRYADIAASVIIFFFFYLMWKFSGGRWMGRGDSDLAFFLALFLGFPLSVEAVLISFWLGAIIGIFLLLRKSGGFTIKSEVPFGPFLAAGTFIAWYLKDFLIFIYEFLYF